MAHDFGWMGRWPKVTLVNEHGPVLMGEANPYSNNTRFRKKKKKKKSPMRQWLYSMRESLCDINFFHFIDRNEPQNRDFLSTNLNKCLDYVFHESRKRLSGKAYGDDNYEMIDRSFSAEGRIKTLVFQPNQSPTSRPSTRISSGPVSTHGSIWKIPK